MPFLSEESQCILTFLRSVNLLPRENRSLLAMEWLRQASIWPHRPDLRSSSGEAMRWMQPWLLQLY
jgi:hypothetical protein